LGTILASDAATVQRALRRFSRVTNLVLASTSVGLLGSGPLLTEFDRTLRAIGSRVRTISAPVPADVELVIVIPSGQRALQPSDLDPGERPLILLAVTPAGVDHEEFGLLPEVAARDGISGRHGNRDVFLIVADREGAARCGR